MWLVFLNAGFPLHQVSTEFVTGQSAKRLPMANQTNAIHLNSQQLFTYCQGFVIHVYKKVSEEIVNSLRLSVGA